MRGRAYRRHKANSAMQRRIKELKAQHGRAESAWIDDPRTKAQMKEQPKRCAKPCCGSQRKWHGPRWQELRGLFFCRLDLPRE